MVALACCKSSANASSGASSSGGGANAGVMAIYTIPSSLDQLSEQTFFDHPWPSDLRLENGSPRLTGFYNPLSLPILDTYITSMQGVIDGFSPAGAGYLRFTGDIDPTTLPATPKDGLTSTASVQLIDIDPSSPEHGQHKLCSVEFRAPQGVYYMPDTLAFMPTVGFPLRTHTRYALVVTDALKDTTGRPVLQSPTVSTLVGLTPPSAADPATSAAITALASGVKELAAAGIAAAHIVHLAIFTTSDPTAELAAVADAVPKVVPAPTAEPAQWMVNATGTGWTEYVGRYGPSPNFQAGTIPFANFGDGGQFVFQNGLPVVQNTFDLRFSLMVPDASACPMPTHGYPIVLYAHGTGGDYESYVQDGTGPALAKHCIATMGIDQIFQGTRPGSMPNASESQIGLVFYNVQNPVAARTNGREAAIDEVQRTRLFTESNLTVPASVSVTSAPVLFDATELMFFGHSQGGLNAPLCTAVDGHSRGGVFSGSGAQIALGLLDKTSPQPAVASLIKALLGLAGEAGAELDVFHPTMSLFQDIIDVEDPINYARLQFMSPRPGFAPKSVYQTEGINPDGTGDTYAPPPTLEAHGLAMGLPLQIPFQHAIPQLAWGGVQPIMVPAAGLGGDLANGQASGVLAQWAVPPGDDGHFVVFDVPAAQEQAAQFLQNLAANPVGLVPAP